MTGSVKIYFKVAFTCEYINYWIDPQWSLSRLYNEIKDDVREDFNVNNFNLVLAGEPDGELAEPINMDSLYAQCPLIDMWTYEELCNIAFYIYPIPANNLRDIGSNNTQRLSGLFGGLTYSN